MGIFKRKTKEERLEQTDKALNKGLTGMLTRAVIGSEATTKANEALQSAKNIQAVENGNIIEVAYATVVAIEDTGSLVNYEPVVNLQLNVIQSGMALYSYQMQTIISKVQIPRIGDTISLGANPTIPGEFIYLGLKL